MDAGLIIGEACIDPLGYSRRPFIPQAEVASPIRHFHVEGRQNQALYRLTIKDMVNLGVQMINNQSNREFAPHVRQASPPTPSNAVDNRLSGELEDWNLEHGGYGPNKRPVQEEAKIDVSHFKNNWGRNYTGQSQYSDVSNSQPRANVEDRKWRRQRSHCSI